MVKNYFNRFRKGKGKKNVKAKKVAPKRGGGMTFAQKVNKIIARNNENKITQSLSYIAPVNTIVNTFNIAGNTNTYSAYTFNPGDTIFTMPQGTNVQQRIGNKIKLKRWIIKGIIEPNNTFSTSQARYQNAHQPDPAVVVSLSGMATNSILGYVDVYFGKYITNDVPIAPSIDNFYQNGSTAVSPHYTSVERLYAVNKDVYKIYWHKRFKLGANSVVDLQSTPKTQPTFAQSNGFSTARTFGFDVTKYVCKNKIITYDDNGQVPQQADIQNLTLFAIFHPVAGDMTPIQARATDDNGQPLAFSPTTNTCYYNINAMSYAEFEDA